MKITGQRESFVRDAWHRTKSRAAPPERVAKGQPHRKGRVAKLKVGLS